MFQLPNEFLDRLHEEYRTRRRSNPAYSLRAFSRDIDINPGRLSQYFKGVRQPTLNAARKIINRLTLSPQEQASWLGFPLPKAEVESTAPDLIDQRTFELITEPIHFTILSLLETEHFQMESRWIARKLSRSTLEVQASLRLLTSLNLIQFQNGKWVPTHAQGVRSSDGVKNIALRRAHKLQLEQTITHLENTPLELRDITSITIPTDMDTLPEVKAAIQAFRRKMVKALRGQAPKEVYRLQIQLIPLTKIEEKKNANN